MCVCVCVITIVIQNQCHSTHTTPLKPPLPSPLLLLLTCTGMQMVEHVGEVYISIRKNNLSSFVWLESCLCGQANTISIGHWRCKCGCGYKQISEGIYEKTCEWSCFSQLPLRLYTIQSRKRLDNVASALNDFLNCHLSTELFWNI